MDDLNHIYPEVVKSPLDKREYRALELKNRMKVILISDPETEKSAACICVAAGSMNDPIELPGLAHLCEHMISNRTEKYPLENGYKEFVLENSGSSNAFTARDHTNFFFDVLPHFFLEALNRFSQFFISPHFTESDIERLVNVINIEHENNLTNDGWRMNQLEIITTNAKHPFSRFTTGNRETLWTIPLHNKTNVLKALLDYHRKYYSSNLMSLAILGIESLDELQIIVENRFSQVVNTDMVTPRWPESPIGPNEQQRRIESVPLKDIRHLTVMFPIPDTTVHYKSAAEGYLSYLIGHEGLGSLLWLLKGNNWVNHLRAGSHVPARGFGFFKVSFDLTPEGILHTENIIMHLFQYLRMLRNVSPQETVWEERRDLYAMLFRFKDKELPYSYVSTLSKAMHDIPLTDVLSSRYIMSDYNSALIEDLMSCLIPEKCRIFITSRDFEEKTTLREPWYGIKYNMEQIDSHIIEKWKNCELHPELRIPPKNDFIALEFSLKCREKNRGVIPFLNDNIPLIRLWFLQDNEFLMPKACVRVEIYSPLSLLDPLQANLNCMLAAVVKDQLMEYSISANVAGLYCNITDTVYGMEVNVNGYDHKLGILLKRIFERLLNFSCDPTRFEILKEYYMRSLKNWYNEQPYLHAEQYLSYLLREKRWSNEDLIGTINEVTLERLKSFGNEFLAKVKLNMFVYGNMTFLESTDLAQDCNDLFESKGTKVFLPAQTMRLREIDLPSGVNYIFTREHLSHKSSCTTVLYQTGMQSCRDNVIVELIEDIANEPCYNQLRTQEQLGYVVYSIVRKASCTQGIQITVQSDHDTVYVESRIEDFIINLGALLKSMTDAEFLQHRTALANRKAEKPKKLTDRANLVWNEIVSEQFIFDRHSVELIELESITRENVLEYFDEFIGPIAQSKKKLSVHVRSRCISTEGIYECLQPRCLQKIIIDVVEWKKQQGLYPISKTAGSERELPDYNYELPSS